MITVPCNRCDASSDEEQGGNSCHSTLWLTGISSGAFTFTTKDSQQHAQAASAGMAVKNVYAFQIAV